MKWHNTTRDKNNNIAVSLAQLIKRFYIIVRAEVQTLILYAFQIFYLIKINHY
jgi:hypothetical protein